MIVFQVQCCLTSTECCFTATETIRTIRDGEPWTATCTFTQLLSSGCGCGMDLRIVCRSMGAGHSSWHKALGPCRMSDTKDASISPQTLGRPLPPLGQLQLSLFCVLFVPPHPIPFCSEGCCRDSVELNALFFFPPP